MPYATGPAGPIHWVDAGAGAPLVLLHGLGGDVGSGPQRSTLGPRGAV